MWWCVSAAVVCMCVCAAAQDDEETFNFNPTGSRVCKTDSGGEGVCVSYAHCYPNKTLNVHGNIDLNEERISGCQGDLDWCCGLPVDLDLPTGPKHGDDAAVTGTPGSPATVTPEPPVDLDSCPDCVKLYRSGGNPRTRSPSGLFCGGVWLSPPLTPSVPYVVTSATCALSTRDQRVWGLSTAGNYTLLAITTHPDYNSGTRVWDVGVADVVGPPPPRGSLPSTTPVAPSTVCTTYYFDKNENIQKVEVRISDDGRWGESLSGRCGVNGAPLYCGGRVWALGEGRGAGGRCLFFPLSSTLSWIFPSTT